MRHQSLISIKYRYVKLAFTLFGIKKNTLYKYVHILSTIEIYSGVEKVPFFTPESRSGESTKLGALHNTGF